MTDRDAFVEEIGSVIRELEGFMQLKTDATSQLLRDSQRTADDLLRDFQQEMTKREEELIKIRRENNTLKRDLEEAQQLSRTVSSLNDRIEKMKVQLDSALKERDQAKEELNKIQELWKRFTSGE